ncbi:MAG: hypothetical protein WCS96_12380 [Victivallales bacterium]
MNTLGKRLGLTVHISILDHKVRTLFSAYPSNTAAVVEDWLLDVANDRGARIVQRDNPPDEHFISPSKSEFSNEELIAAICLTQRLDRPQLLRLAAQFITRGDIDVQCLVRLARRERVEIILGEMAKQALKVDCNHPVWRRISEEFPSKKKICSPVIHWQRLAWPVMTSKGYNAEKWRLVG